MSPRAERAEEEATHAGAVGGSLSTLDARPSRLSTRSVGVALAALTASHGLCALILTIGDYHLAGDSFDYLHLARNVAEGKGFTRLGLPEVYRQPAYPFLVAASLKLIPDLEQAGHFVSILCGLLAIPATYWAARRILSPEASLLSAALLAANAFFVDAGANALSETANALGSILAIGCLLQALVDRPRVFGLLFGLACAAAYLCRSESLLLFPAGVLLLAWKGRARAAVRLQGITLATLGLVLVCWPYWRMLHGAMGHFSLGGNSVNLIWYQTDADSRPPESFRSEWAADPFDPLWPTRTHPAHFAPLPYLLENQPELVLRYLRNALTFLGPLAEVTFYGLGLPLLFLGLRALKRVPLAVRCAMLAGFLPALALPFRAGTDRLLKPYLPLASILMALGLVGLALLHGRRARVALAVLALALVPMARFARHLGAPEARGRFRPVGAAMRDAQATRPGLTVMAATAMPGFHARAETVAIPDTRELAQVVAQMDRFGATYLVVDREETRPGSAVPELEQASSKPGLVFLRTFPGSIDLYQRVPAEPR